MYQFTNDCLIGIPEIDNEHAHLFELLNKTDAALHVEDADVAAITARLLNELYEYAVTHFSHEEAYMLSIDDPEFNRQSAEHEAFRDKVTTAMNASELTLETAQDLLTFLAKWLYRHILGSDILIGKFKKTETTTDAYVFSDEYLTGIGLIDDEHRQLFALVNEVHTLVHDEFIFDKYDEIMRILTELRNYTEMHFRDEEAYMEKINYADLDAQRRAHNAFIEKLVDINFEELENLDNNQQEYLQDILDFLAKWLVNHILKMDKLIG
ncbi:MAG: bacteriohemerythrin [Lachnospiraceae bacterium]|nr:bacteriohemerythrin [Lachnospiraceae bacterium]